ncbi:DUF4190 domain-containing protein [Nocardioides sp.]|uniref:DUF4190 domain-containing protein n=1 Tax=Nocardioides sp. TaxID=35761 RepID=UPI002B26D149|nr:DUF4190 domain-containing protein [Nocardioides sp.]
MSNPYDPNSSPGVPEGTPPPPPPYGQTPYGQTPYNQGSYNPPPYGQETFGQDAYGTYGQGTPPAAAPTSTDAVSITAFVLSFTCFLSPVALILGIVGLSRTKNNKRKGRWAAIAAIPLGLLFSILGALVVVAGVFFAQNVITPSNAEVGQCVDVSRDGSDYNLLKVDCVESHDAEIIYVGVASDYEGGLSGSVNPAQVCTSLMAADDLAALEAFSDDLLINLIIRDPEDIEPDDEFLCFVELTFGSLDAPIL